MSRRLPALPTIAAVLALAVIGTLGWLQAGTRLQRTDNDLEVFVRAGARALAGESLYQTADGAMIYKYAPGAAFLFTPLAPLDSATRSALWFALTIAGLAVVIGLMRRYLIDRRGPLTWRDVAWAAATIAIVQWPIRRHLTNGQIDLWVLVLCLVAFGAGARARAGVAGAAWAVAAALKLAPALLVVYFAHQRAWRTIGAAAAATAAIALAPIAWWGGAMAIRQHTDWVAHLASTTPEALESIRNQSVAGVVTRLTSATDAGVEFMTLRPSARSLLVAVLSLAVIGLVLAIIQRAARGPSGPAVSFSAVLAAVPILMPVSWDATYVLLLPAVGLWLRTPTGSRHPAMLFWTGAVLLNLVISARVSALGPRPIGGLLILFAWYLQTANPDRPASASRTAPGQ